jgi:hypothetical protein
MGFSAEKAHSSAWNFFPKALDIGVERTIQLARAYEWMGEVFRMP